jgi:sporulation protein YlmC with PRC-barrel domain
MKKITVSLASAALLILAVPAGAQQAKVVIPSKTFYRGQEAAQYLAKDRLIGSQVHDKDGKIIGEIEDLILNNRNELEGVIIGVGGLLGAGEKQVGVRYPALQITKQDNKEKITLPGATKEVLAALEPYKRAQPKKTLLERAKEKAEQLSEKTKETAGPAPEKAKEATKGALEKGKELIESTKEKISPNQ